MYYVEKKINGEWITHGMYNNLGEVFSSNPTNLKNIRVIEDVWPYEPKIVWQAEEEEHNWMTEGF